MVCITTGAAGTYYSNMLGLNSRRKLLPLLRVHSEAEEREERKTKPGLMAARRKNLFNESRNRIGYFAK